MLCRNCNYILSGKENFCPNCGTMPYGQPEDMPKGKEEEILPERRSPKQEEPVVLYPKHEPENEENIQDVKIFYDSVEEDEIKEEKNTRAAGKIFLLLFLTCALAVTAFGLADYFGITPSVKSFVQTLSQKKAEPAATSPVPYSHEDSIVEPDINYSVSDAYIMSGNGLTLRKGPDNSYAPVHSLTDLTKVHIFGGSVVSKNWVYVYCPEKESYGWLDGRFLATEENASAALTDETETYYDESFM